MGLPDCAPGQHDFAFLRQIVIHHEADWQNGWKRANAWNEHRADRFYCRRCLVYVDRAPMKAPRDDEALVAPVAGEGQE